MLTQPIPVASPAATSPTRPIPWDLIALGGAGLAAHLPLLIRHLSWLWVRPHYQFFPLVLVGAAVLAFVRLRGFKPRRGDARTVAIGLLASWLVLVVAVAVDSSWLGCVAAMALAPTLAYAGGGRDLVRRLLPAWGMLWLLVPPPLDLDRVLIFQLQGWTTGWSSAVLDAFGVLHVRAGNAIETGGRTLFVEQACSGINSLFSVLACTLFLVLFARRGWIAGVILMSAAVGWVLAANVARVVLVAVLETRWGVSAATGWQHETLGLVLFAVAVGLVISTDRLLAFLARPTGVAPPSPPPTPTATGATTSMRTVALLAVPVYLLLLLAYLVHSGGGSAEPGPAPTRLPHNPDLLPPTIDPWVRTDYIVQSRSAESYFGEHSHTWRFTRNGSPVQVSLDAPFPGWHDLTWCYVGTGWRIESQSVNEAGVVPGGFIEARLSRPVHRFGYLLFCQFDRRGQPLTARPGGTAASPFRHRMALARLGLGDGAPSADPAPPVYQLQVFAEGSSMLTAADEEAVRDLFIRAQQAVREAWAGSR